MGRLDNRVAVVTGAARGIGAATAALFAREGAAVVLCDRDVGPAERIAAAIAAVGGKASVVAGDCAAVEVAAEAVRVATDRFGGLDILVNNAGSTVDAAFHGLGDNAWAAVQHDGLSSAVVMTRLFLDVVRERVIAEITEAGTPAHHRKIINTAPAAYLTGSPGSSAVAAVGGAVAAMTRTMARELGSFAINVNAVAPGFIETRITRPETEDDPEGIPEPVRQMTRAMTALGRWGTPEDVARVHVFLAGEDSDFVSGVTIPVTGGLLGT